MIYNFDISNLPKIENAYTVVRNTVWQAADPFNILIMVTDGKCRIRTNEKERVIESGDCVFLPAGQSYTREPIDGIMCRLTYVHFSFTGELCELEKSDAVLAMRSLVQKAHEELLESSDIFTSPITEIFLSSHMKKCDGEISGSVESFERMLEKDVSDNLLLLTLGFCRILARLSKKTFFELGQNAPQDDDIVKIPENVRKAVFFIKQKHAEKITVEQLCDYCRISCSQLTRNFKNTFGTTPMQYIISYKIYRAKEMMLTSPEQPIKNIAMSLGFDDQHYFSRIFTKICRETPSEYKYRVTHFVETKE